MPNSLRAFFLPILRKNDYMTILKTTEGELTMTSNVLVFYDEKLCLK